jgi:hypothetical protein
MKNFAISPKLGKTQTLVLARLSKDKFFGGCSWVWKNYSSTVKVLESLVRLGLVKKSFVGSMSVYQILEK